MSDKWCNRAGKLVGHKHGQCSTMLPASKLLQTGCVRGAANFELSFEVVRDVAYPRNAIASRRARTLLPSPLG